MADHPEDKDARNARLRSTQEELSGVRAFLESAGLRARFRALERPRPWISVLYIVTSWLLIAASIVSVIAISTYLLPLALLVIGSRMRSLQNNLHDASHGAIRSPAIRWFLAASLLDGFESYARKHLQHHAYLGDPVKDPDYLAINDDCQGRRPLGVFLEVLLTRASLMSGLLGRLHQIDNWARLLVVLWWVPALGTIAYAAGSVVSAQCFAIWMAARVLVLRPLETYTELSDHVGLPALSPMSYTRNAPATLLSWFIHPHNDGYHLTHHLAPRVPLYHLRRAHEILMGYDDYRRCQHCDGYFLGPNSIVRAWTGTARKDGTFHPRRS